MQCDWLADEISKHEPGKVEMEENKQSFIITSQFDMDEFKFELCRKIGTLDELNLKYDMLKADKDVVNAKLQMANDNQEFLQMRLNIYSKACTTSILRTTG